MNTKSAHTATVTKILALSDDQAHSALCFLAGYAPKALEAALVEMNRQAVALAAFKAAQSSIVQPF